MNKCNFYNKKIISTLRFKHHSEIFSRVQGKYLDVSFNIKLVFFEKIGGQIDVIKKATFSKNKKDVFMLIDVLDNQLKNNTITIHAGLINKVLVNTSCISLITEDKLKRS